MNSMQLVSDTTDRTELKYFSQHGSDMALCPDVAPKPPMWQLASDETLSESRLPLALPRRAFKSCTPLPSNEVRAVKTG